MVCRVVVVVVLLLLLLRQTVARSRGLRRT